MKAFLDMKPSFVEVKYVGGRKPTLYLVDSLDEQVEEVAIDTWTKEAINTFVQEKFGSPSAVKEL